MRNIIISSLLLLLAITACSESKQKEKHELAKFLEQCEEMNLFSGSVLVMQKGEKIFEGSYGYKNFETKEKNTNESIYRAFSITKTFTAMVILQLEEEGKLSVDDKISKYFPSYAKGDSITIKNLLGHTSGIINETATENTVDEATFLKFISDKPLEFSPNNGWNYSNSNYYLLGYIIKHVTGNEYDKEIEQRILKPIGMNNSGFHFAELQHPNKAEGYRMMTKNNAPNALIFKGDHPYAAGALYSTTNDLYKFSEAIQKNTLIKPETFAKASEMQHGSVFGLGIMYDTIYNKVQIGHSGGGPGYLSHMRRVVEDDITLIFYSNNESLAYALAEKMYRIILGLPYDAPSQSALLANNTDKLVGTYTEGDKELYIRKIDDNLVFSERFGGNCSLYPISDSLFQLAEDVTLTFKADSLILNIRNQNIIRAKKNDVPLIWGIIGDATPSGWDGKDIPMAADATKPAIWKLENYKLKKGGFQFRMNNGWSNNVSLNSNGEITTNGYNFEVEDGTYNITLDLTDRWKPKCNITKVSDK